MTSPNLTALTDCANSQSCFKLRAFKILLLLEALHLILDGIERTKLFLYKKRSIF